MPLLATPSTASAYKPSPSESLWQRKVAHEKSRPTDPLRVAREERGDDDYQGGDRCQKAEDLPDIPDRSPSSFHRIGAIFRPGRSRGGQQDRPGAIGLSDIRSGRGKLPDFAGSSTLDSPESPCGRLRPTATTRRDNRMANDLIDRRVGRAAPPRGPRPEDDDGDDGAGIGLGRPSGGPWVSRCGKLRSCPTRPRPGP
jgi:hypothetical protein